MKISTRSRYGLRLMLELALGYGRGPILLRDIARRQDISEKYLSQIIIPLKSAGLVTSFRGARGGYTLQRPPEEIRLHEVVGVLEGDFSLVDCLSDPKVCGRASQCVTQGVWQKVSRAIASTLEGMTLRSLVEDYSALAGNPHGYAI